MISRQAYLERIREIPALPPSVAQIVQLLRNPEVDAETLRDVVELDPGLTSNILRLANSAYFGGRRSIDSVRDAIVRLGNRRIEHLAIAASLVPLASSPVRGYDLPPKELLRHSVAVAMAIEFLAAELGAQLPPYAFTAAVLHDVGKIVLGTFLEVDAEPILNLAYTIRVPFDEAERQVLGIDHAEAGAELLEAWNVPENIIEIVRWHHAPDESPNPSFGLDVVHVANQLVRTAGIGVGMDGMNYLISEASLERLSATQDHCDQTVASTVDALGEVADLLASIA